MVITIRERRVLRKKARARLLARAFLYLERQDKTLDYQDASSLLHSATSNMVVVASLPDSTTAPPAPDLSEVPSILSNDATIQVSYPSGFPNILFMWTFQRSDNASPVSFSGAPSTNVGLLGLPPGSYTPTLTATDGQNTSPPAAKVITLDYPALNLNNLPSEVPVNGAIDLKLPPDSPYVSFTWDFQKNGGGTSSSAHAATLFRASVANFSIGSPHLDLALHDLDPGTYLVTVTAADSAGNSTFPAQATITLTATDLGGIRVHPSPWRSDLHSGHDITFDNVPTGSTIKIFTVSGRWVATLSNVSGSPGWNLKNDSGNDVASGLYLYLITDSQGGKAHGKFAVIR